MIYFNLCTFFLDINECLSGTAACTQLCYNTDGSYKCSCNNGFILASDERACNGELLIDFM